ncbi:MAG TPA: HAD family phosphatase [Streptosporangiaceae bacterium]|nr:HAD family phosphatase [Streptosporangiaceae bacterium]
MADLAEPALSSTRQGRFRALITDWGGVMTNPILEMVRAWLDAEDVDPELYGAVIRPWVVAAYDPAEDGNPIHTLERGECPAEEFEHLLASRITRRDGAPVPPAGLLSRMFAAAMPCEPMYQVVYGARAAGLRTGLLSNSWGTSEYPRHLFPGMFDAVVISAEVGMRKPEERIFRHAVELLGLAPGDCVFVDDIPANIAAAEAVGMTAVLHTHPTATVTQLGELLSLPPGWADPGTL